MIIEPDFVLTNVRATSKKQVLAEIAQQVSDYLDGQCTVSALLEALVEREKIGSTAIGNGVAIPHMRIECLDKCLSGFIRLERPVNFEAVDGEPVDLIYVFLAPERPNAKTASLMQLARISNFFRDKGFRNSLRETNNVISLIHHRNDEIVRAA